MSMRMRPIIFSAVLTYAYSTNEIGKMNGPYLVYCN